MKALTVAAFTCVIIVATGCSTTTPKQMRTSSTATEFSSSNNAKTVATCIADGWEKVDNELMKVQMRPITNGYSVWVEQSVGIGFMAVRDSATFLADINDISTGSVTRYYSISTSKIEWKAALEKCFRNPISKSDEMQNQAKLNSVTNNPTSQKLNELKELKSGGLITEEEYQRKRRQLIDKM